MTGHVRCDKNRGNKNGNWRDQVGYPWNKIEIISHNPIHWYILIREITNLLGNVDHHDDHHDNEDHENERGQEFL